LLYSKQHYLHECGRSYYAEIIGTLLIQNK
jgi:hypothetical protein